MGWISSKRSNGYGLRGKHRSFWALVVSVGGCWERESDLQGTQELGSLASAPLLPSWASGLSGEPVALEGIWRLCPEEQELQQEQEQEQEAPQRQAGPWAQSWPASA